LPPDPAIAGVRVAPGSERPEDAYRLYADVGGRLVLCGIAVFLGRTGDSVSYRWMTDPTDRTMSAAEWGAHLVVRAASRTPPGP